MKCAIITCSECKKRLFSKPYYAEYVTLPAVNENILIINLTFTPEKFYLLSKKKKELLAEKICLKLQEERVFCVYLSGITNCPEFSKIIQCFHSPDGKSVLKYYAGIGACILSAQCNLNLSDVKIAVYQETFNHTGFEILCDLSQYFKNITIIGKSENNLEKYTEQLMEHCGLSIDNSVKISSASSCDFLFLLDKAENYTFSEKTIIIDLTKSHSFHCLNTAKFEMPLGFNKILPYFTMFDDLCLDFILRLTNSNVNSQEEVFKIINGFGGKFKTFCAKSKIMLDK